MLRWLAVLWRIRAGQYHYPEGGSDLSSGGSILPPYFFICIWIFVCLRILDGAYAHAARFPPYRQSVGQRLVQPGRLGDWRVVYMHRKAKDGCGLTVITDF